MTGGCNPFSSRHEDQREARQSSGFVPQFKFSQACLHVSFDSKRLYILCTPNKLRSYSACATTVCQDHVNGAALTAELQAVCRKDKLVLEADGREAAGPTEPTKAQKLPNG